jgi:acyl CoA:acetate/3-ketoacid CoA transferase
VGTVIEKGKEKRKFDGREYLFETPIIPDIGLVKAHTADTLGNLVYRGTGRGANPAIAMASRLTIAEVFEVVEPGALDPETIVTPGVYVDRIVRIPDEDVTSLKRRSEFAERLRQLAAFRAAAVSDAAVSDAAAGNAATGNAAAGNAAAGNAAAVTPGGQQ